MKTTAQVSTKQDILQHLLKQGQATAQELAEQLSISPQAIRRHLKDLETEGLIQHQAEHLAMGRPQYIYQLSSEGRDRFPDNYNEFAIGLLDALAETIGIEKVSQILQKQWQRKALEYRTQVGKGSLQERVTNLAKIRKSEGYLAECYPASDPTDSNPSYVLTEYHCAISQIAESFPSVCGHELEMFAVALEGCKVERTHWMVDGQHRCGYLIQCTTKALNSSN